MSNLTGPALEHIRAAERDGVAARTMPAARRLSMAAWRGGGDRRDPAAGGGHIVANPYATATPKVRLAFAVTKVLYDSYYSPL